MRGPLGRNTTLGGQLEFVRDAYYRLAERIRRWRQPPGWEKLARENGLWPICSDWVGMFAVDREGELWFATNLDWSDKEVVKEAEVRHVASALAAARYRRFRHLKPQRSARSHTCPTCGGGGRPNLPPEQRYKIICSCGGLGWVPAGWQPPQAAGGPG